MDQQHQQMNSGLTRYRSAPSSYFASLINSSGYGGGEDVDQFFNPRASSPDSDRFFSRFMSSIGAEDSLLNEPVESQFLAPMKHEPEVLNPQQQQQQQQQMVYQSQSQLDHKPFGSKSVMDNPYNVVSSMGMDRLPPMKIGAGGGGSNSNLIRQSSSPAGLFAQINVDNGYAVRRGMSNFGAAAAGGSNAEASFSSGSRLKNQMDFPPGPPSSSGIMPHASEIGGKSLGVGSPESGSFGESHRNDGRYTTGDFPNSSWDDSALLSDNFLKGIAENERKTFSTLNSSETQSGEGGNPTPTVLAHHLSLPTSSAELSAMEKLLQFHDSVPLKIRAKRGCATHPRSIAERVRRTRISERMRKLQELVPNMDKQTNTADMLDLAVDYIKDLQKQVKTLSENRAKCTCSNNQKT